MTVFLIFNLKKVKMPPIRKGRILSRTRKPLEFRNPFRTTGVKQVATRIIKAPIIPDGYSREGFRYSFGANRSGISLPNLIGKQAAIDVKNLGIIPDYDGVDLSSFMNDSLILPSGVASLEKLQKQRDVAHQIQQFNAKILDDDQRAMKSLSEFMEKKKKIELRKKIVQWLAETDDLDEVPTEYREAVADYYKEKYPTESDRNKHIKDIEDKRREKKKKITPKDLADYNARVYYSNMDRDTLSPAGYGWRAPRLHRLVRPIKEIEVDDPEKIIEDQKDSLEERREFYKNFQTEQRGIQPPKDMVERAIPKMAEPIYIPQTLQTNTGVILHPFIFPKKRYDVYTGIM